MDTVKVSITVTFTLPADLEKYLTDNYCEGSNYQTEIHNPKNEVEMIPNPESKDAFMQRKVGEHIKNTAVANVTAKKVAAAIAAAKGEGDNNIKPGDAVASVDAILASDIKP